MESRKGLPRIGPKKFTPAVVSLAPQELQDKISSKWVNNTLPVLIREGGTVSSVTWVPFDWNDGHGCGKVGITQARK